MAVRYNEAFRSVPGLTLPEQHPESRSSWHLYVLRDEQALHGGRDAAFEQLCALNIGVQVHYIPVYRQPYYRNLG
ncbi:DegT/DnrJ/EryC1/StrS family aminotransferase [Cohnella zeiphila]|uniref:DegT/DnrJ/EryC1/StrS family aminotransferase n=1 Tax=Cohnella zeiphila TaxID=2761120 RepID=UPI003080B87B